MATVSLFYAGARAQLDALGELQSRGVIDFDHGRRIWVRTGTSPEAGAPEAGLLLELERAGLVGGE